MNYFVVSKAIRFSRIHISSIALSDGLQCAFSFSGVLSTTLTLCAWYLGKGALTPVIRTSRFASFRWRFTLQNKSNTNSQLLRLIRFKNDYFHCKNT